MERFLSSYPQYSLTIDSPEYPSLLKKIPDPPASLPARSCRIVAGGSEVLRAGPPRVLYFRGNINNLNKPAIAIVGTRRASDYGKEIALSFSRSLRQAGLIIVSGMAIGIDTWSHRGALEASGPQGSAGYPTAETNGAQSSAKINGALGSAGSCPTVAVMGTGLDEASIYPRENLRLAKQILDQGGCLLSEYPTGTAGSQFTFPKRNRIIAGLSLGVLIVEAKIKSGALITAYYGKKYGRKIFAVPGSIHSQNAQGCHLLIKQGAILVENANDILRVLNLPEQMALNIAPQNHEEKLVTRALGQGALHIDKIIEITKLTPSKVSSTLSMMELDDKIKNLGGNIYALTR